jgi:hypothetical protein
VREPQQVVGDIFSIAAQRHWCRTWRYAIDERINAKGGVPVPLDEAAVSALHMLVPDGAWRFVNEQACFHRARPPADADIERLLARPYPAHHPLFGARWGRIRRVFAIDVSLCPRCGGSVKVLSVITDPGVVASILKHVAKREARAPPVAA